MNEKTLQALADVTIQVMKQAIAPLKAELAAAKLEIEALKARPQQKWAGVHVPEASYSEASLVTRRELVVRHEIDDDHPR